MQTLSAPSSPAGRRGTFLLDMYGLLASATADKIRRPQVAGQEERWPRVYRIATKQPAMTTKHHVHRYVLAVAAVCRHKSQALKTRFPPAVLNVEVES